MAYQRRKERLRTPARGRRLLRAALILLLLSIPLLYFAFTKVFFDPYEEPQRAFADLVPRDVDLYLRRERLDSDVSAFPVPDVVTRLMLTREFRDLQQTGWWQALEWPDRLAALAEEAGAAVAEAPIDPVADLLGRELVLVGREPAAHALLARLSGKGKLAYEALSFDAVRERAFPGSTLSEVGDPDVAGLSWRRLELPGSPPLFLARSRDLLVAGDDEALVRDVLRTEQAGQERSLGYSRLLLENLPAARHEPEHGLSLELMVDLPPVLARLGLAEPAPAEASRDALRDMLRKLVDPALFKEAVARVELEGGDLLVHAHAEVDAQRAAASRTGLVGLPHVPLTERVQELARLLPGDTSALLTMNVEIRSLLQVLTESLDPDVNALIASTLKDMARYSTNWQADNLPALISYLDRTLADQVTLALRPLDHEVPQGSQPLPVLAFVLKVKDLALWQALDEAVVRGRRALGIDESRMWERVYGVGRLKWLGVSGLPMEEIAYVVLDMDTLVVATDEGLLEEIVQCYTRSRAAFAGQPALTEMLEGLERVQVNAAAFVRVDDVRRILAPYARWIAERDSLVDRVALRLQRKDEIVDRDHPEHRGRLDELPAELDAAIEAELDRLMADEERRRLEEVVPRAAAAWLEGWRWLDLVDSGLIGLRLGESDADLVLRVRTVLGS